MAELRTVAAIEVSPHPEAAVRRPRSPEIYVTGPGGLDRIDAQNLKVYLKSRTNQHPRSLVFSSDGRLAYYLVGPAVAANSEARPPESGTSHIVIYDCEARREAGQIAARATLARLALSTDGKMLLATDPSAGALHCFDIATRRAVGTIQAGRGAGAIAVLPYGSKAFVANAGENTVSVADLTARRLFTHIQLGLRPDSLLLKPDGGELFVLSPGASSITVVDTFHDNVLQMLPAGRDPVAGAFRRDSSVLYLANAGDGSVMALDVTTRAVLASTFVGSEPRALALTPDERFLAVADAGTSSLAVLIAEPSRMAPSRSMLVTSLPVGARPVAVIIPDANGQVTRDK
jgi:YVTN family beta-propeller protein